MGLLKQYVFASCVAANVTTATKDIRVDVGNVGVWDVCMTRKREFKNVLTTMFARRPEFLSWEKERFEDLGIRVSHKIPLCKLPPWESVPALRLECYKRCKDEKDHACMKGMKTEAKLQRWLLTRYKCELTLFDWFMYEITVYYLTAT